MAEFKCQCLCGAVTFTATPKSADMGACHCNMCRRWSGGVFLSTDCSGTVTFDDETHVGRYRGSSWGERVFCTACGSTLIWQTQDGSHQSVSIQAFEDAGAFGFKSEIFIDEKPGNYGFANKTKTMTGAEVFAMFAPPPQDGGQ